MAQASSSGLSSVLAGGADTIVAVATPQGRGALAVVRVSGGEAFAVAGRLCPRLDPSRAWRAQLVEVWEGGEALDRAVAIPYRAPRSSTGEDMVELLLHGSPYLVRRVVEGCVEGGARPAVPGEFTRRAVANGKLDVVEAEAVRDLVAAETRFEFLAARRQLRGELSRGYRELRDALAGVLARLEGTLDFSDSHGVGLDREGLEEELLRCQERIGERIAAARRAPNTTGGQRVVLVGPPNAGKSTLFNRLLGRERAIVAAEPGTTRDVVEAELDLGGRRVVLVDTAGLGSSDVEVDREGMRRARAALDEAAVAVILRAVDDPDGPAMELPPGVEALHVASKADLGGAPDEERLRLSAHSGEGVAELEARIAAALSAHAGGAESGLVANARHLAALERAAAELEKVELDHPEIAAEAVRWALSAVDELVGVVATDEVLDRVFATFCIGK